MISIIHEASSVAKAIEQVWIKAGKPQDFSVKVFEESEKNFFGFTTRKAKIAIFFKDANEQSKMPNRPAQQNRQQQPQRQQKPIANNYPKPQPPKVAQPQVNNTHAQVNNTQVNNTTNSKPIVQSAPPVSNQNITTETPQQGEAVEKKTSYAQRRRRKKATANANPTPEKTSEIK